MKKLLIGYIITVCLLSCGKEVKDEFHPYTNLAINDTTWSKNSISKGFTDSMSKAFPFINYTATFPCSSDKTINLVDTSLTIAFTPYACIDPGTGNVISNGNITVQLVWLRNKGDFIKFLIPTTSTKYLLQSAGTFNVQVSQNNMPLAIASTSNYTLKWLDKTPFSYPKFLSMNSLTNTDSLFSWDTNKYGSTLNWDSTGIAVNPANATKKGYLLSTKVTGWISSGQFLDTLSTARTRTNILLSPNFTNKNTLVFVVFKNLRTVVRLAPDFTNRCFYTNNVPVGASVSIVTISYIDNNFYLGVKDAVINSANAVNVTPQKSTAPDILSILDNL